MLLNIDRQQPKEESANSLLITPRIGTISPWSSKATEIARLCGLSQINRLERGTEFIFQTDNNRNISKKGLESISRLIYDRMTESIIKISDFPKIFNQISPRSFKSIEVIDKHLDVLTRANKNFGWAMSREEIEYIHHEFSQLKRNPTDVEIMMFAQANSEHCRHKIFNSKWIFDGTPQELSLFQMVKTTHKRSPKGTITAYSDNGAVMNGGKAQVFFPFCGKVYSTKKINTHSVLKVETHNHPTAISPYSGASTGAGGEIRDEGATGRGGRPKAGLTGFCVSHLRIPELTQPWEKSELNKPDWMSTPLDIMLEAPIGSATFNNEFGRPNLAGYFRTFEMVVSGQNWGFLKPIMIAGGLGSISDSQAKKNPFEPGSLIIQIGGPGMRIGLGGGAASSQRSGANSEKLDYDSVQRGNPEMQRRAQEVISACSLASKKNPILSIHDVGAGGLSNALPELVDLSGHGAIFNLRAIPVEEEGMDPLEIWCNESQERYVIAISPDALEYFSQICKRERCPFSVIGRIKKGGRIIVRDELFSNNPIDIDLRLVLGGPPIPERRVSRKQENWVSKDNINIDIAEATRRVLSFPAVADKSFLITIADRSVGGLSSRDQLIGPWQVPVSDVAVTLQSFDGFSGEAFAIGERPPLALLDPRASARISLGEAITNIASAQINRLSDVKVSANWMAGCGDESQDVALFDSVKALTLETCADLGISIPVGKDSLSMRTRWKMGCDEHEVTSPMSVVISAFAPVIDARKTVTPQLQPDEDSCLLLIDLGQDKCRMGGSALYQTYELLGNEAPDLDSAKDLTGFFGAVQDLKKNSMIMAYHDRSDGGLFVTLSEMMFASHIGIDIDLRRKPRSLINFLFNEELGAVIQVKNRHLNSVRKCFLKHGYTAILQVIGGINTQGIFRIKQQRKVVFERSGLDLQRIWSETSYNIRKLRDNPDCAHQEYEAQLDPNNPGLSSEVGFKTTTKTTEKYLRIATKPRIAILREQGVNGHIEMAVAFHKAGFEAVDVHMSDILSGDVDLSEVNGMVACGGFSFGDVLGAGKGWGKSILLNSRARSVFQDFFERTDTFGLGVCNGCQMMSEIKEIIPGANHWPSFHKNISEQFESRFVLVEILDTPSIFFSGMVGARLPVVVSHGEGYILFQNSEVNMPDALNRLSVIRYIDNYGNVTQKYPFNPNGSHQGLNGFTSMDGRFTIMMPHPERVFLNSQNTWSTEGYTDEFSSWFKMFQNARDWIG